MKPAALAEWFTSLPIDNAELIKLEFAVAIDNAIKSRNMNRKQMAEALETSPAWVSKVLRGDVNLTIESMEKLCKAIGFELQITIAPKQYSAVESTTVTTIGHVQNPVSEPQAS